MAPLAVSPSQQTPVEQLLVPEHASASPVHAVRVVQVRPLFVAQQTCVNESHGAAVPHAIWSGPPSPGDIPAPEEATPPEELLDDPLEELVLLPPDELLLASSPVSAPSSLLDELPPDPPLELLASTEASLLTVVAVDPPQATPAERASAIEVIHPLQELSKRIIILQCEKPSRAMAGTVTPIEI